MQAIQTVYRGPTNTRGSCIAAKCAAGSLSMPYDHGLSLDGNHEKAAKALCKKLGWEGEGFSGGMLMGGLPDGSYCHVFRPTLPALNNLNWREEGEANHYALLSGDSDWVLAIHVNGRHLVARQRLILETLTGVSFRNEQK